jgi:hypothetical protein
VSKAEPELPEMVSPAVNLAFFLSLTFWEVPDASKKPQESKIPLSTRIYKFMPLLS